MRRNKYERPVIEKTGEKLKTSAMIASLGADGLPTISAPFGHALKKLAKNRPEIVGMSADLSKYTDLHIFAKEYPDRFYQMGMAEQLLVSSAAGMAKEGFIPFITTYAVFATRRAYDFIHQCISEEGYNVKICCALPGLTTGYGPSHQATEDIAMMRGIPDLTIIDPCDALEIQQAVPAIADYQGPVYMRLPRGKVPLVLDKYNYKFEVGKAKLLTEGKDVLIISTGLMTMRSLEAVDLLKAENIDVSVLHCATIKPLDKEKILEEVSKEYKLVIVAENHTEIGGLGEAIATLLLTEGKCPSFMQIALPDEYLDAGALPTLHTRYGISSEMMVKKIKNKLNN
ncbi:transketolase family protein [Arcobacter sp.]|uniref:transketolase family protein n=1 Tax=Arcobacter sp. TaxID=1872629 RepID=UPI003C706D74